MIRLIALAILAVLISACSFKTEFGYHGETGRDDRVISQGLYLDGVSQKRVPGQRY